ncbi:MAG TPA: OsmC family peroxiredoxin [Flavobacteriales bacterium]|nr:OsmC family peroxiredoxin [Flavobacteriales bacterium]
MKNNASAIWKGTGKEGSGTLKTNSGVLNNTPYSFKSRTENTAQTNPEELIAAAHAGCFAMKLSFLFSDAGYTPETIETGSEVTFESGKITSANLSVKAKIPGIAQEEFKKIVDDAGQNCPVSQALKAPVTVASATLNA